MQSKNGGLAAWEPAGAQEWLEVSIEVALKCAYGNTSKLSSASIYILPFLSYINGFLFFFH
jgi:hypothetical protein